MKRGFTLIELLVVVIIIGILAVVALPQYASAVEKAKSSEAVNLMAAIAQAAERYRMQHREFPTELAQLDVELPSLADKKITTKDFTIEGTRSAANGNYLVTATRNTGKYNLYMMVDNDGNYIRCCGSSAPSNTSTCGGAAANNEGKTICNAITNGNSTNGEW